MKARRESLRSVGYATNVVNVERVKKERWRKRRKERGMLIDAKPNYRLWPPERILAPVLVLTRPLKDPPFQFAGPQHLTAHANAQTTASQYNQCRSRLDTT